MHIMGKIGVWLVVVASLAATVLMSKLVQVRNSWTKKSVAAATQYRNTLPKIDQAQEELNNLEGERFRALDLWGTSTLPVQTTVQPQGALVVNLGTSNSFFAEKKVVYGFEIQQDGTSIYRGDFTVTVARDVQSELKPNWVVRQEDGQTWQTGNWRFRNQLPSAFQPNFDRQILLIGQTEDILGDRRQSAVQQAAELAKVQDQLKLREAELVGGDLLSKNADTEIEFREGYVAAVEQTEETRNKLLTEVDELRRKLRSIKASVDQLEQTNRDLAAKLPKPTPAQVTSKP